MTMYQASSDYFEPSPKGEAIPEERLEYFRRRLWHRVQDVLLEKFVELNSSEGLTKADLARLTGKDRATISRAFATPGNLTLDTISDLLLAMEAELDPVLCDLAARRGQSSNQIHPFLHKLIRGLDNPRNKTNLTSENNLKLNNTNNTNLSSTPRLGKISFSGQKVSPIENMDLSR